MKYLFVTYEIAEKLKELGFNEPCIARMGINSKALFWCKEGTVTSNELLFSEPDNSLIALPLWQQAVDWLNEHPKLPLFKDHVKYESCKENLEGRIIRAIEKIHLVN